MKTKYLIASFILISSFIITGLIIAADIQYPIPELNNCQNEAACKTYCDKPENTDACINFAEKNNLMSPQEIIMAKKFLEAGDKGPGGCSGKDKCEEYCNDINHINECIAFAEENNLIPPEELEEAHKVQAAINRGIKPPTCGNKKTCDIYCETPDHMEECITFGIEAGFIQGKELKDVQKMLAAVKRGVKPPPCRGKKACDEYCQTAEHMEVCMNFALEAGFMTSEEATMSRKTGGKGPGGCKGKEECETFCNNPDNQETCFNFGKEHGLIPEEDLRMMPPGQIGGPGDCKGPEECQIYCESHPEECQKFQPGPGAINPGEQMMPPQRMMPPEGMTPPPEQTPSNLLQIFLDFLRGK